MKIKIEIIKNNCRSNYFKDDDTFIVDDLCPPICIELFYQMYPYLFALKNNGILDYGDEMKKECIVRCPDQGRVIAKITTIEE